MDAAHDLLIKRLNGRQQGSFIFGLYVVLFGASGLMQQKWNLFAGKNCVIFYLLLLLDHFSLM